MTSAHSYDMLHLLPSLPYPPQYSPSTPISSSSSWDDLPSDLEDTFFLSGDEDLEVYEREKKRRWLEVLRDDRLREKKEEEDNSREMQNEGELGRVKSKGKGWGGDDETVSSRAEILHERELKRRFAATDSDLHAYVTHRCLFLLLTQS